MEHLEPGMSAFLNETTTKSIFVMKALLDVVREYNRIENLLKQYKLQKLRIRKSMLSQILETLDLKTIDLRIGVSKAKEIKLDPALGTVLLR